MVKHTPGPWESHFSVHGDPSVCTDVNRPAFTKVCDVSTSPSDYGQANCRLIAAAPELLRLLREAVGAEQKDRSIEDWLNNARSVIAGVDGLECFETFDCANGQHSDACPAT